MSTPSPVRALAVGRHPPDRRHPRPHARRGLGHGRRRRPGAPRRRPARRPRCSPPSPPGPRSTPSWATTTAPSSARSPETVEVDVAGGGRRRGARLRAHRRAPPAHGPAVPAGRGGGVRPQPRAGRGPGGGRPAAGQPRLAGPAPPPARAHRGVAPPLARCRTRRAGRGRPPRPAPGAEPTPAAGQRGGRSGAPPGCRRGSRT